MLKVRVLVIIVSALLFVSCTRDIEDGVNISIDTSSLNFHGKFHDKAQQNTSQAVLPGYYPKLLIANLHYDNQTEVAEWECPESLGSNCSYPSSINFANKKFPNGSGRVVQVLLVYQNSQEQLLFYYANALNLTFAGGTLNVVLNTWENNGASPGIGKVGGRYFTAGTNVGPSGHLVGKYSPNRPNGYTEAQIPDMRLFKTYMFNGYFQVFFLRGNVKFSWDLVNPNDNSTLQKIFTQKTFENFSSLSLSASTAAILVERPEFYNVYQNGSNHASYLREKEDTLLGYFKPNAAGNIDIYSTSELASGGFYFRSLENGSAATVETLNTSYRRILSGNLVNPINDSVNPSSGWVDPSSPTTSGSSSAWEIYRMQASLSGTSERIRISKGVTTDSSGCISGLSAVDSFVTDRCFKVMLGLDADSGVIPFRGPFALIQNTSSPNSFTYLKQSISTAFPSTHTEFKWKYVPAILASSLIEGTDLFLLPRALVEDENEDMGLDCSKLSQQGAFLGSVGDMQPAAQYLDVSNSLLTSIVNAEVIACPFKVVAGARSYYPFGIKSYGVHIGSGLSPISLSTTTIPSDISQDSCMPITVNLSRPSSGMTTLNINTSGPSILSSNNTCLSSGVTSLSVTFMNGESSKQFWIDAETIASNIILTYSLSGDDMYVTPGNSSSFNIVPPQALNFSGLTITMTEGTCYPLTIERNYAGPTIDVTLPTNTANVAYVYYTDSSCTNYTTMPIATILGGTYTTQLGVKAYVANTQASVSFMATSAGYSPAMQNITINDAFSMIFITSSTHAVLNGGSVTSWGDAVCTTAATTMQLPGVWKAVLSSSTESAATHIGNLGGKALHSTRGTEVATTISSYFSTSSISTIYDESGGIVTGATWTGSNAYGLEVVGATCNNWSDNTNSSTGTVGNASLIDSYRLNDQSGGISCDSSAKLICIDTNL